MLDSLVNQGGEFNRFLEQPLSNTRNIINKWLKYLVMDTHIVREGKRVGHIRLNETDPDFTLRIWIGLLSHHDSKAYPVEGTSVRDLLETLLRVIRRDYDIIYPYQNGMYTEAITKELLTDSLRRCYYWVMSDPRLKGYRPK